MSPPTCSVVQPESPSAAPWRTPDLAAPTVSADTMPAARLPHYVPNPGIARALPS